MRVRDLKGAAMFLFAHIKPRGRLVYLPRYSVLYSFYSFGLYVYDYSIVFNSNTTDNFVPTISLRVRDIRKIVYFVRFPVVYFNRYIIILCIFFFKKCDFLKYFV